MVQRAWHQALAYAVTGQRLPELGHQSQPDLAELAARLGAIVTADTPTADPAHRVPDDLMQDLGAAQFRAALTELRILLSGPPSGPVLAHRPLTAAEQRLDADRPPHY